VALIDKGDTGRAKKALDYCNRVIPGSTVRHGYGSLQLADYYYKLNEPSKGNAIMDAVAQDCVENLDWYFSLTKNQIAGLSNSINQNFGILYHVLGVCKDAHQKTILDKYLPRYMEYTKRMQL